MDWRGTDMLPSLGHSAATGLGERGPHRGLVNRNPALAPIAAPPHGHLPNSNLEAQERILPKTSHGARPRGEAPHSDRNSLERSSGSGGGQQLHIGKMPHGQHGHAHANLEQARHAPKPVVGQDGPPPQSARSIRSSGGPRDLYRSGALTSRPTSKGNWGSQNHGALGGLGALGQQLQQSQQGNLHSLHNDRDFREKERE